MTTDELKLNFRNWLLEHVLPCPPGRRIADEFHFAGCRHQWCLRMTNLDDERELRRLTIQSCIDIGVDLGLCEPSGRCRVVYLDFQPISEIKSYCYKRSRVRK